MKRYFSVLLLLCITAISLSADISVDVPRVVGLDEQFKITFTLDRKPSQFEWTPGDNFQLVWGPQTGSSTSISIVNGKATKSSQYTYTYILLPRRTGNFTMPAARATVEGREVESRAPGVEVVGNGASQAAAPSSSGQQDSDLHDDRPSRIQGDSDIFMRFSLSRTSVVAGEPINATLKLYTRADISGFEDAKFPTFNGFWAQETESPQNISFSRESVGDKIYNAAVLRRWVIIPQKTGSISIEPAELVCLVQQRISHGGGSIFDGFFDDYQTVRKRVTSSAYTVKVSPLPSGAPASFTGAVGSFKISASLSTDSLKVHDAASLSIVVTGKGNVALVGSPKVKFPPDSEVYDTKNTDRLDAGTGGTSGSRVFEYPFIPRSHGDFVIDPIEFSYYDISARRYVILNTEAIPYYVAAGEASDYVAQGGVTIPAVRGKDVKSLGEDIHYINTKLPRLRSEGRFFVGSALFWWLFAAIFAIAAAIYFIVTKTRAIQSDVALVRTRGASKAAKKRLSLAGGYLAKNLYSAFYEELHKALLGYASDKLNIGSADLSKEGIAAAFNAAGAPQSLVGEFTAILDTCEFARYAPDAGNAAMQESYDKAVAVISSLETNMKKSSSHAVKAVLLVLLLSPAVGMYAEPQSYVDSLWNAGVEAYAAGSFAEAGAAFGGIEQTGLSSPELFANIADCHFKQGNNAYAVLYYERALKLDPSFRDAQYNLSIVNQKIQDRIESVPEFFLTTWNRKICYSLSSNVWAMLALVFAALTLALVLLFLLARSSALRKTGFFCAIASLLLMALCLTDALWQKHDFELRDTAIVTRPVCPAKSAPSAESGSDLFVLHEGTKIRIQDTVGDWTNIVLADGREGWVKSNEITVI